jgi:hypothetical protein
MLLKGDDKGWLKSERHAVYNHLPPALVFPMSRGAAAAGVVQGQLTSLAPGPQSRVHHTGQSRGQSLGCVAGGGPGQDGGALQCMQPHFADCEG